MKVRQMKANIDINGKDPENRTNERTNERTKQKFMNELSTTRENEENPFFPAPQSAVPAIFRKYRELLSTIFYVNKNKEISQLSPMKICKNGDFRHISGIFGRK